MYYNFNVGFEIEKVDKWCTTSGPRGHIRPATSPGVARDVQQEHLLFQSRTFIIIIVIVIIICYCINPHF